MLFKIQKYKVFLLFREIYYLTKIWEMSFCSLSVIGVEFKLLLNCQSEKLLKELAGIYSNWLGKDCLELCLFLMWQNPTKCLCSLSGNCKNDHESFEFSLYISNIHDDQCFPAPKSSFENRDVNDLNIFPSMWFEGNFLQ